MKTTRIKEQLNKKLTDLNEELTALISDRDTLEKKKQELTRLSNT